MQKTSRLKKLALLLIPAALVLSACESKNELQINEDGTARMFISVTDDTGMLSMAGMDCDALSTEFARGFGSNDFELQDNSDGSTLDCSITVTSPGSIVDGTTVVENGDTFEINFTPELIGISASDLEMFSSMAGDNSFELAIVTPGEIVSAEASVEGTASEDVIKVDGNRAVITNLLALVNPVKIVGKNTADSGSSTSSNSSDTTSTDSDNSGFGTVAWVLLGAIVLGVIAVVAILVTRKKSNNNPYAGYGAVPTDGVPGNIGYAPAPQAFGNDTVPTQQYGQPTQQYGQPIQQQVPVTPAAPVEPPVAPTTPIPTETPQNFGQAPVEPPAAQTEPPAAPQA